MKETGMPPMTTEETVERYRCRTEALYGPVLRAGGLPFPPRNLWLLAFKEEGLLEVYTESAGRYLLLHTYPFTARSGQRGPKLREGDGQIPEGIYAVEYLNPNSRFHLSFKLDYPNARDRRRAGAAGITEPGTDIFIHGGAQSTGCIAIGDAQVEELFTLVALAGTDRVSVVIFPEDARKNGGFAPPVTGDGETAALYRELKAVLDRF